MNAIYELLPVLSGMVIACFYYAGKALPLRNAFFLPANILAGYFANWLSGEGGELILFDIALSLASSIAFLLLSRIMLLREKKWLA